MLETPIKRQQQQQQQEQYPSIKVMNQSNHNEYNNYNQNTHLYDQSNHNINNSINMNNINLMNMYNINNINNITNKHQIQSQPNLLKKLPSHSFLPNVQRNQSYNNNINQSRNDSIHQSKEQQMQLQNQGQSSTTKKKSKNNNVQILTVSETLQNRYIANKIEIDLGSLNSFLDNTHHINNNNNQQPQSILQHSNYINKHNHSNNKFKKIHSSPYSIKFDLNHNKKSNLIQETEHQDKKSNQDDQDDEKEYDLKKSKYQNPLEALKNEDDEKKRQQAAKIIIQQIFKANYGEEIEKFEEQSAKEIYRLRNQDDVLDSDHQLTKFLKKNARKTLKEKIIVLQEQLDESSNINNNFQQTSNNNNNNNNNAINQLNPTNNQVQFKNIPNNKQDTSRNHNNNDDDTKGISFKEFKQNLGSQQTLNINRNNNNNINNDSQYQQNLFKKQQQQSLYINDQPLQLQSSQQQQQSQNQLQQSQNQNQNNLQQSLNQNQQQMQQSQQQLQQSQQFQQLNNQSQQQQQQQYSIQALKSILNIHKNQFDYRYNYLLDYKFRHSDVNQLWNTYGCENEQTRSQNDKLYKDYFEQQLKFYPMYQKRIKNYEYYKDRKKRVQFADTDYDEVLKEYLEYPKDEIFLLDQNQIILQNQKIESTFVFFLTLNYSHFNHIQKIDLYKANVREEGILVLLEVIRKECEQLKILNLGYNKVGQRGISAINKIITQEQSNIMVLGLKSIEMTTKQFCTLCIAMASHQTIIELDVSDNALDDRAIEPIKTILRYIKDLYKLNLSKNHINEFKLKECKKLMYDSIKNKEITFF